MYVARLQSLLVEDTFAPGSVTTIAAICNDWFRDEGSLVSFVFRSVFRELNARDWAEQAVPTEVFDRFVTDVLPCRNAALTVLPGDPAGALQDLVLAYRGFT
jgi:hypothetical protein